MPVWVSPPDLKKNHGRGGGSGQPENPPGYATVVGEIIMWLARTRDYCTSYSFTRARSRPTFHNTMTRKSKPDASETDVSPKKMKI